MLERTVKEIHGMFRNKLKFGVNCPSSNEWYGIAARPLRLPLKKMSKVMVTSVKPVRPLILLVTSCHDW